METIMKRAAYAVAVATLAVAVAAPAIALPNVFWTFGWDFPKKNKPWTIGRSKKRKEETQMAAAAPAVVSPAVVEPVVVIPASEPIPGPVFAWNEPAVVTPLAYDLAGL
jgi:hypothetical protein